MANLFLNWITVSLLFQYSFQKQNIFYIYVSAEILCVQYLQVTCWLISCPCALLLCILIDRNVIKKSYFEWFALQSVFSSGSPWMRGRNLWSGIREGFLYSAFFLSIVIVIMWDFDCWLCVLITSIGSLALSEMLRQNKIVSTTKT